MTPTWTKIDIPDSLDLDIEGWREQEMKTLCAIFGIPAELIDCKTIYNGTL